MFKFTFQFCLPLTAIEQKKAEPKKATKTSLKPRKYKPTPPPFGDGTPEFHREVYAAETPDEAITAFRRDFPTAFAVRGTATSFTATELAIIQGPEFEPEFEPIHHKLHTKFTS